MDPFTNTNSFYHGIDDTAHFHTLHSPQGSLYRSSITSPAAALDQGHQGNGHLRLQSSKTTRTRTILDRTTGRNARRRWHNSLAGTRGADRSDYTNLFASLYCMDESSDSSDRYTPSSSDKLTCSDHRPLDQIFGKRHVPPIFTPLKARPTLSFQAESAHSGPSRASVHTYALPIKPQIDGIIHIPLLAVDNRMKGTDLVVAFRYSDWGIGVTIEGIPMTDLLRGDYSELEHPHERVLNYFGLIDLRLNIIWPNYSPFAKTISAFGTDGKPLTRAGLGYEVALAFAEFYSITSQAVLSTQPGPYTIASFRPGSTSPGITFNHLRLITVRNTSLGEWMAEVRAVSSP